MTRAIPARTLGTVLCVGALLAFPSTARAQGYVSPLVGFNFGGDAGCPAISDCEDRNLNIGVSFGSLGSVLGSELEIGYARDFFGASPGLSSNVLTVMGNAMLAPRFGAAQPYGVIGLGLIKTRVELSGRGLTDTSNNHFGWDVGGGLIVFVSEHVGVRGDVRYFHAFQDLDILGFTIDGAKLDFGRAAAAVVFRF